ncbi:6-phosphofructo-2-kinase-domain-containing protein [Obelidium mucronatum]|nr:6-phosphofructo-2-kinase-domain-containing protein [Obelidium mucronatum]
MLHHLARLCVAMVGLPARGKTYTARKVARFLSWLGHPSEIFNVGNYRRNFAGASQKHDFFDPNNAESAAVRQKIADLALDDMVQWFKHLEAKEEEEKELFRLDSVSIHDATNSTKERRKIIMQRCEKENIQVMFVESICDRMDVVLANIKEVKLSSPDYLDTSPEEAVKDFMSRIYHYSKTYETLSRSENNSKISFVKLINIGERVLVNNVRGYIQSRIVYFLMNLNITPRCVYFSRHGESQYNVEGKIGGDSDLSPRGWQYAQKLPELIARQMEDPTLTVWTSTLKRTIQTASGLAYPQLQWKALDELDSGERYPDDFAARDDDKYNYRYKGGESYADLVRRLEPVTLELERHHERNHPILIVGHQAVLRALYAYFMNYSHDELPYVKIPLHTLVKLTFKAYGCIEERFKVDIEAVDTHRPRITHSPLVQQSILETSNENVTTPKGEKEQADEEFKQPQVEN